MSKWFVLQGSVQQGWSKDSSVVHNKVSARYPVLCGVKDISKLGLHDIPGDTFSDIYVSKLLLSHNNLTHIPSCVVELRLLTHIDLSHNRLLSFPIVLLNLAYLKILILSHNMLSALPEDFYKLQRLEEFNISHNKFRDFPTSLCSNECIVSLIAHGNNFLRLPKEIGSMTSLRSLDLRKTGLTELPDSLQHLINLEVLRLEGNPLHSPPLSVVSRGIAHVMAFLVLHSLGYRRNSFGRQPPERKAYCERCEPERVMSSQTSVRSGVESKFSSPERPSLQWVGTYCTTEKDSSTRTPGHNPIRTNWATEQSHSKPVSPEHSPSSRYRSKGSPRPRPDSGYSTFGYSGGTGEPMKPSIPESTPIPSRDLRSAENTSTLKVATAQRSTGGAKSSSDQEDTSIEDELSSSDVPPPTALSPSSHSMHGTRRRSTEEIKTDKLLKNSVKSSPNRTAVNKSTFYTPLPDRNLDVCTKQHCAPSQDSKQTSKANSQDPKPSNGSHLSSTKTHSRTKHMPKQSDPIKVDLPDWVGTKYEVPFSSSGQLKTSMEFKRSQPTLESREGHVELASTDAKGGSYRTESKQRKASKRKETITKREREKSNHVQWKEPWVGGQLPQQQPVSSEQMFDTEARSIRSIQQAAYHRTNRELDYYRLINSRSGPQAPLMSKIPAGGSRVGVSLFLPTEKLIHSPNADRRLNSSAVRHTKDQAQNPTLVQNSKFDNLNRSDLERIYRLRKILENGLRCRLPKRPEELITILRSGVHLADWLSRTLGPTANIKVYDPRLQAPPVMPMKASDLNKYFRVNLRRCRELMGHHGVPKEQLFSVEDILNTNSTTGLPALANSVCYLDAMLSDPQQHQTRSPAKHYSSGESSSGNIYTNSGGKPQFTSMGAKQHNRSQPTLTKLGNPKLHSKEGAWPQRLCSDV